jgi:hypothetical protein
VLDRDVQVRKAAPEVGDELLEALGALERLGPGRRVETEVRRDDLVGDLEPPLVQDLLEDALRQSPGVA